MLTTNVLLVAVPGLKCTLQARILLGGLVDRYCTHLGKLLSDPKVEPGGNCTYITDMLALIKPSQPLKLQSGPCFILSRHISFDAKDENDCKLSPARLLSFEKLVTFNSPYILQRSELASVR
jgi:hypothetical protein